MLLGKSDTAFSFLSDLQEILKNLSNCNLFDVFSSEGYCHLKRLGMLVRKFELNQCGGQWLKLHFATKDTTFYFEHK